MFSRLTGLIDKDFAGILTIWGAKCTFTFAKGYLLEIRPFESDSELFLSKCRERNGNYESLEWIHGISNREYDVAFFPSEQQGPLCYYRGTLTLVISIVLQAYNIKGTNGEYLYAYKDLHGFNAIDFSGKAVDAIFPPKAAIIRTSIDEQRISWYPSTKYAKAFDVAIHGVACKLVFTIEIERQDLDIESTSLGSIHSIIRLAFPERQDLSMIEPCWQAVCTFLSFCIGQQNVTNLDIGLWDEEKNPGMLNCFGNITCEINNDKGDDIESIYPAYFRFQIGSLGEKVGSLFQILINAEKRPILGFFPRTNTDHSVDRNKIRVFVQPLK